MSVGKLDISTFLVLAIFFCTSVSAESHQEFEQRIKKDLTLIDKNALTAAKVVYLSGDIGPWINTGLLTQEGDRITTFAQGQRWLSFEHQLSFEADLAVWKRIGNETEIFRGPVAHTFDVHNGGNFELKLYPTIRWLGENGEYAGEPPLDSLDSGGGVSVVILQWSPGADIAKEMQKIAANSKNGKWATRVVENSKMKPDVPPQGWDFLHELGPSKIWTENLHPVGDRAPSRAIDANISNDVSIITHDINVPLTETTTLNWKWRMDNIPGITAENTALTHDYLSIAVAFENGQDLTYYWSKELEVGEHFACPLPGWVFRETHIVARSGEQGLGQWLSEEKSILADYKRSIGGALPTRITGVWLIGVGIFKKVEGAASFGDIRIVNGAKELKVY